MKIVYLAVLVGATGCATVDDVYHSSSGELCYRVAAGNFRGLPRSVYYTELDRRNEDCSRYQAAIANQLRANAAQEASGLLLLQAAQPKPSPTVNCTSTKWGNEVQTTCR